MNNSKTWMVSAACVLAAGCAAEGSSTTDSTLSAEAEIQGGSVDTGNPAVGLLWIESTDRRGNVYPAFCTGTLIAPTVVLTAAHCTTPTETDASLGKMSNKVVGFYLGAGTARTDATFDSIPDSSTFTKYAVSAQATMTGYNIDTAACPSAVPDIGLVRLSQAITTVAPVAYATTASQLPATSASCTASGYGTHGSGRSVTYGQKRTASEKIVGKSTSAIQVTYGTGMTDQGDSGGPLLCGGVIVGTTSCGSQAARQVFYGRLDGTAASFISKTLSAWK